MKLVFFLFLNRNVITNLSFTIYDDLKCAQLMKSSNLKNNNTPHMMHNIRLKSVRVTMHVWQLSINCCPPWASLVLKVKYRRNQFKLWILFFIIGVVFYAWWISLRPSKIQHDKMHMIKCIIHVYCEYMTYEYDSTQPLFLLFPLFFISLFFY